MNCGAEGDGSGFVLSVVRRNDYCRQEDDLWKKGTAWCCLYAAMRGVHYAPIVQICEPAHLPFFVHARNGTRRRSVDSLGRERKATRSRSQGSSDSGRDRRRRSRRRKRAKDKDDNGEEFGEMEKALGWRGAMARASRSASVLPPGDGVRRKGWSSSSSAGSFSSDRVSWTDGDRGS